jgi:hypothetical protein
MKKTILIKMCSLLLATGWTNAFAQESPTETPAQRMKLTLVDNKSTFDIDQQLNLYENTLRLTQSNGNYLLTAGMLNQGDNMIVLHRSDDLGGNAEVARVNLSATKITPEETFIDGLDFYGDGSSAPSSNTYITQADLAGISPNWGTSADGQGLVWQTNGCAYIQATDGLTFTIPQGYSNASIKMSILVGPDASGGYWAANVNSAGWSVVARATTGYVSEYVFTGMNSGDVIMLLGANSSSLTYSPDIAWIEFSYVPTSFIPSVDVTSTVSYWDGSNWSSPTAIGQSRSYNPNDTVDLYGLGNIIDSFNESTASNTHPESYSYGMTFDANVEIPSSAGTNFYASADFTACTTSNPASASMTGHNGWNFNACQAYSSSGIISMYIEYYGAIIYTMPASFMGTSVTVTVTSSTGSDGAGILIINNEEYTFTAGSTHSWTVPVTANGVIEFKSNGETYSADIARIMISSGNSGALNAPVQGNNNKTFMSNSRYDKLNVAKPIANSQKERITNVTLNDK